MWCSAHLHCHFRNLINLPNGKAVEFQSCDKPINRRKFFDVFKVEKEGESRIQEYRQGTGWQPRYAAPEPKYVQKWVPKQSAAQKQAQ